MELEAYKMIHRNIVGVAVWGKGAWLKYLSFGSMTHEKLRRLKMCIEWRYPTPTSRFTVHTVRKSRNINMAKKVSIFLICGNNDIVEHYGKGIKNLG